MICNVQRILASYCLALAEVFISCLWAATFSLLSAREMAVEKGEGRREPNEDRYGPYGPLKDRSAWVSKLFSNFHIF